MKIILALEEGYSPQRWKTKEIYHVKWSIKAPSINYLKKIN